MEIKLKKSNVMSVLIITVLMFCALITVADDVMIADFEAPIYYEGYLSGQDGWFAKNQKFRVQAWKSRYIINGAASAYGSLITRGFQGKGITRLRNGSTLSFLGRMELTGKSASLFSLFIKHKKGSALSVRFYDRDGEEKIQYWSNRKWNDLALPGWGGRNKTFKLEFEMDFTKRKVTVWMTPEGGTRTSAEATLWTSLPDAATMLAEGGFGVQTAGSSVTIDDIIMNDCISDKSAKTVKKKALRVNTRPKVIVLQNVEVYPSGKKQQFFKERLQQTPTNWRIRPLPTGKKFLQTLNYNTFKKMVETENGKTHLAQLPWAKEAIVRMQVGQLKDLDIYKDMLENKTNPIIAFGFARWMEPVRYGGKASAEKDTVIKFLLKVQKDFGERFMGIDYGEWSHGGVGSATKYLEKSCEKIYNIPLPANHDEGTQWWEKTYDTAFKKFHDAGIPVYSFNATSINHYEARKGSNYTGNEISYMNPALDSTLLAFCRGAARQFNIPWGSYSAGFGGSWGHNRFRNSSPDELIWVRKYLRGAYSSVPLQDERRAMYSTYMGGGNFINREGNGGMVSGWDPLTIGKTHPRIVVLQDKKRYVGPYGLICSEVYNLDQKHDRGIPYTPIALMFDRNHGLAFRYSKTHTVGNLPYTTADNQMRAVINTIFPYQGITYHRDQYYTPGPFGDVFDVITTDASVPVINSYRAVMLVGQARVNTQLASELKSFVKKGGLLFMVCEQMTPELWKMAGITDTGKIGTDSGFLRENDFYVYKQKSYKYHKVKLNGAKPLFLAEKYANRVWPVATINRIGKGAVIAATPVWLNVKGDHSKMHSLFSEIMTMISGELVPVKVYGNKVKVMYNRNKTGWIVTLMNNRGIAIAYPGYRPATRQQNVAAVILKPQFEYSEASEWLTGKKLNKDLSLMIPPGEIRIIEFKTN